MSRESLARATNSTNLEMAPDVTHDVDRLAAAASGNTLGGLLLRLREGGQGRWAERILLILANRIGDKHRLTRSIADKTAEAALLEFISPHCTLCKGAKVMMLEKVKIICEGCGGSGLQRFSNASRREHIGTYGSRIEAAMSDAHNHMSTALGAYQAHAAGRLE